MQKTRLPLVMLLGMAALLLLSGCGGTAPTPTQAMREAEGQVPGVVDLTATPTPTPTPTPESTETPTPTPTPTPEATPTPDAEAKAQQDLQELQQAFAQLVEQYPEGYTETFGVRGDFVGVGGELGLGRAAYGVVEEILRALDPSWEAWSAYQLYLKEHPDAKLIVHFKTNRAVWCRKKWSDFTCQFTEQPVEVIASAEWFAGRPIVREAYALNPYTEQVAKRARDWTVTGLIEGSLPFWKRGTKGYWTQWQTEVFVWVPNGEEGRLVPLIGFQGKTRHSGKSYQGDALIEGEMQVFNSESLDAEVVHAIIQKDANGQE